MTAEFKIYCGLDTRGQLTADQARETALGLAADWFPHGHTISEEVGRWQDASGVMLTEPTIVISWTATAEQVRTGEASKRVSQCAGSYKVLAFQESVLITSQEVDAIFI